MCGLTVIASTTPDMETLRRATRLIAHRGPDDEGYAAADGKIACASVDRRAEDPTTTTGYWLGMGHRRLAILDTSEAGHQPMADTSGQVWVVFNGEIYNYRELAREINYPFRTKSDTEVLLAAYLKWGEQMLPRLNGMFSFVIFDQRKKRIFAARDRFGIKPLYAWRIPEGGWILASEIKQFTAHPSWRARWHAQRVYDFLVWGISDHERESMFDGVIQFSPGECVSMPFEAVAQGEDLAFQSWYSLRPQPFQGGFHDAAEQFQELFVDAVRLRLRADVPVGSCLSGGLDSSSVVCVMHSLLPDGAEQKTFSACSREEQFDERRWAEIVADRCGVDAYYVYPELSGLWDILPRLTWHQDEPFGSTSIYAQWHVFRLARKHGVIVMLDGQGADEQLAGYHAFFRARLIDLGRRLRLPELWKEIRALRSMHGYGAAFILGAFLDAWLPEQVRHAVRRAMGKASVVPEWIDMKRLKADPADPFLCLGGRKDGVQELSLAQLTGANVQMLLHWEDRNSMAHSVEARVPFLDYRLVEFVLGLPSGFKIAEGVTKRVLREAMRGILPDEIRQRKDKLGFVTPEEIWLRREKGAFRKKVEESIEKTGGAINDRALKMIDDMADGLRAFHFAPWRIISLGEWVSTFDVKTI